MPHEPRHRRDAWLLGAVALLVTLPGLGGAGLWFDEVATLVAATRSGEALAAMLTRVDAVHAAYYGLMHLWLAVVPATPFFMRMPSAVAIAVTAAVVTRVGQQQWGRAAGLWAGFACIVVPRSVWMAVEARSFALATAALTVAVCLLLAALAGGRLRAWVGYAVVLAVAGVLFFYVVLVVPALVAAAVWQRRRDGRPWWPPVLATALGLVPVVPVALAAFAQRGQVSWIQRVGLGDLVAAPRIFLGGFLAENFSTPVIIGSSLALVVTLALVAWLLADRLRVRGSAATVAGRGAALASGPMLALLVGWLLLPAVVLLTAGLVLPLYDPKYCAISVPALALLVGWAVGGRGRDWRAVVALALLGALGVQYWVAIRQPDAKGDLAATARAVAQVRAPGDALWIQYDSVARAVVHAAPDAFAGMRDLTVVDDVEHSGTLWETERPLAEVADELGGVQRVVGITRAGRPVEGDLATWSGAGFTPAGHTDLGDYQVWVLQRR